MVGYRLWIKYKQEWGQIFFFYYVPKTAALPRSDDDSDGVEPASSFITKNHQTEWLNRRDRDRHGLGSKPTRAILTLLYPWERHFTALSPAWWS